MSDKKKVTQERRIEGIGFGWHKTKTPTLSRVTGTKKGTVLKKGKR